jgi:hypothetical protein
LLATDRINVFNNVPGTIVTLMDTSNVENVFVAGKVAKWHGKLVGVDLNRVRRMIEKSRDAVQPGPAIPRTALAPAARFELSSGSKRGVPLPPSGCLKVKRLAPAHIRCSVN